MRCDHKNTYEGLNAWECPERGCPCFTEAQYREVYGEPTDCDIPVFGDIWQSDYALYHMLIEHPRAILASGARKVYTRVFEAPTSSPDTVWCNAFLSSGYRETALNITRFATRVVYYKFTPWDF